MLIRYTENDTTCGETAGGAGLRYGVGLAEACVIYRMVRRWGEWMLVSNTAI